MPIGLLFWVLFVLALVFNGWGMASSGPTWRAPLGGLILTILIFLLGWKSFGFIIQG